MSASSVSVDPKKVEAIMSLERVKSVFKIRSLLGLARYYRNFTEDFSRLAAPIIRLTRKGSSLSGMTCVRRHSRSSKAGLLQLLF